MKWSTSINDDTQVLTIIIHSRSYALIYSRNSLSIWMAVIKPISACVKLSQIAFRRGKSPLRSTAISPKMHIAPKQMLKGIWLRGSNFQYIDMWFLFWSERNDATIDTDILTYSHITHHQHIHQCEFHHLLDVRRSYMQHACITIHVGCQNGISIYTLTAICLLIHTAYGSEWNVVSPLMNGNLLFVNVCIPAFLWPWGSTATYFPTAKLTNIFSAHCHCVTQIIE